MAIVNDGSTALVPLFTDVLTVHHSNAFVQTAAQQYYFGYINTSNNAVVQTSTDGINWSLQWNFGSATGITLGLNSAADLVQAAVWQNDPAGSAVLYDHGVLRLHGTFGGQIGECFYTGVLNAVVSRDSSDVYLAALGIGFGGVPADDPGGVYSFGPGEGLTLGAGAPIIAVLNLSPNRPGFHQVVQFSTYDPSLGWQVPVLGELGNWRIDQIDPFDILSPQVLKVDDYMLQPTYGTNGVDQMGWPGFAGGTGTFSGFRSFVDFAGVSVGASSFSWGMAHWTFGRALFFPGFDAGGIAKGNPEACDQGLQSPHQLTFSTLVDSRIVLFFVDAHGLFGTTAQDGDPAVPDATGNLSSFGTARIYGTSSQTFTNVYGPATQSGSFSCLLYASGAVYLLTDRTPFLRTHAARTVLYSQTAVATSASINTKNTAVGSGRDTSTTPSYNIALLRQACTQPNAVPNPNHSAGSSSVLRAIMQMSGVSYKVTREIANDGQQNGHLGGNAIDVAGGTAQAVTASAPGVTTVPGGDAVVSTRPLRFYDTGPVVTAVQAAGSIAAVQAAIAPFASTYGFQVPFMTTTVSGSGPGWTGLTSGDLANVKLAAQYVVEEFSKYPPSFVQASGIQKFQVSKTLSYGGTGYGAGAFTLGSVTYYTASSSTINSIEGVFGAGFRQVIQHEYTHIQQGVWPVDQATWTALNPPGFTYGSHPAYSGSHPTGFTDDYDRTSAVEDQAQVNASMMMNPKYQAVHSYITTDQYLLSKLEFWKAWQAAINPQMTGNYFAAVNGLADYVPDGSTTVSDGGYTPDELDKQGLVDICNYLRKVPSLFAAVIHYDPDPANALYIYDGKVVDASAFGGATSPMVQATTKDVHIQSSSGRLLAALSSPIIIAAFGVGPAYIAPGATVATTNIHTGQFADRYVYVNADQYTGSAGATTAALTVNQDKLRPKKIDRW